MVTEPLSIGGRLKGVIAAPDRLFALLLIAVSLGVFALGIVRASPIALLIGVLIGIPGAVWYLLRGNVAVGAGFRLSDDAYNIVSGLFFLVSALALGSFALRDTPYDRPEILFVLIPVLVGCAAIGAFGATRPWQMYLGLVQVLLIGLLISWTQIIMTPDVIGFDPWYHKALVEELLRVQTLPDNVLFAEYITFPIFHLTVAAMRLMTGLPYHLSAMLSISLILILVNVLFVALFAACVCPSRPALRILAPLIVVISPLQIYMLYWLIPNGFAMVFVLPVLYLLYMRPGRHSRREFVLLALFLGTLILAHTVTGLFMAIALFVVWAAFTVHARLVAPAETFPLRIPLLFTAGLLLYWSVASGPIHTIYDLIAKGFNRDSFSAYYGEALLKFRPAFPWETFVASLTHYVFLFLPLLGMLYLVSRRGTRLTYSLALLGITPLAVISISYLLHITVIEDRWVYFAAVLNSIAIGVTLLILYGRSKERPAGVRYYTFMAVLLLLCSLTVLAELTPNASIDYRPLSPSTAPRPALSASEGVAVLTAIEVWDPIIQTDEYYFQTQRWTSSRVLPDTIQLFDRNLSTMSNNMVLVREATISAPRFIYSYDYIPYYDLDAALLAVDFSRIYDVGSVHGYLVWRV